MSAVRAEASLSLSPEALATVMAGDAFTTARIAGIMAAKRVPDLIPLRAATLPGSVTVIFEPSHNAIRVVATGKEAIAVMTAVSMAALTLYDMAGDSTAVIGDVRLTGFSEEKKPDAPRRSAGTRDITSRGERVRPQVLMGEVASPRAGPDVRREAFRNFMTSKRLRPTTWAKDAGVTTGEIMGFLTGRSRGFSGEVAEKLARAARVSVEDMFR